MMASSRWTPPTRTDSRSSVSRTTIVLPGLAAAIAALRNGEVDIIAPQPSVDTIEEVKGRCLMTGLPRAVTIDTNEVAEALIDPVTEILDAIQTVLERTPPELVADISQNGIILCGGGSLVPGIDKLIGAKTGIRVRTMDDPVSCVAYGAGKMLARLNEMDDGMINLARKRQMK